MHYLKSWLFLSTVYALESRIGLPSFAGKRVQNSITTIFKWEDSTMIFVCSVVCCHFAQKKILQVKYSLGKHVAMCKKKLDPPMCVRLEGILEGIAIVLSVQLLCVLSANKSESGVRVLQYRRRTRTFIIFIGSGYRSDLRRSYFASAPPKPASEKRYIRYTITHRFWQLMERSDSCHLSLMIADRYRGNGSR